VDLVRIPLQSFQPLAYPVLGFVYRCREVLNPSGLLIRHDFVRWLRSGFSDSLIVVEQFVFRGEVLEEAVCDLSHVRVVTNVVLDAREPRFEAL
jgi:hypothetical protein